MRRLVGVAAPRQSGAGLEDDSKLLKLWLFTRGIGMPARDMKFGSYDVQELINCGFSQQNKVRNTCEASRAEYSQLPISRNWWESITQYPFYVVPLTQ